jgi:hypothetical protein
VENRLIIVPDGEHVFDENMQNPIISSTFDAVLEFMMKHLKIFAT